MARVAHHSIEDATFLYKGPALLNWHVNSQLVDSLKRI